MRIDCLHGYFKFIETRAGQISEFNAYSQLSIASAGDHFTLAGLLDAPDYSIEGGFFLGCPTTKTFEGEPWEVMRENGLVYDLLLDQVVPILSIVRTVSLKTAGSTFIAQGIIQPGSIMDDGSRVTDYSAFYTEGGFRYSEVSSE